MAGADIHRFSIDRRGTGLNALLATAAGGLAALADTLLLPTIVVALFAGQLTDSFLAVGVLTAIGAGFWVLGRIPASLFLANRRRKLPWALGASLVRVAALGLLTLVTFRAGPDQVAGGALLRVAFICVGAFSLASGFASVPTEALVAKAAPTARRAEFYRQRSLVSGVGALVGALVAARALGAEGPAFPQQFAVLFLAAAVCHLAVAVLLASIREPLRVAEPRWTSPVASLRATPRTLGDPGVRRFLVFRVLLALTAIVDPFLVLFALSRLGVPPTAVGGWLVAYVLGILITRPMWAALARGWGERTVLQGATLLRLAPPLIALALPHLSATAPWRDRAGDGRLLEIVFGAAFWCIGAAVAGQARGTFGYLGELASNRSLPAYIAVVNGAIGIAAFAPIGGGLIVTRLGYDGLFVVSLVVALCAVFASGALADAFVRRRRPAGSRERSPLSADEASPSPAAMANRGA